jgi:hypothetical protein
MTDPQEPEQPQDPAAPRGSGGRSDAGTDEASHGDAAGAPPARGTAGSAGTGIRGRAGGGEAAGRPGHGRSEESGAAGTPAWGSPDAWDESPPRPTYGPTYGPTHASTYGPMFPPTPPYGVQQPYPPPYPPPQRQPMALGVKVLIGAGLVFALLVASGPLFDVVGFFSGWEVAGDAPTTSEPSTAAPAPPATAAPGPQPTEQPYRQISAAEWADILRNPLGHEGRRVILFGRISAAPVGGSPSLRAAVAPARLDDPAEYVTPVLITRLGVTREQAGWQGYRAGDEIQINGTIRGLRAPDAGTGSSAPLLELGVRDEIAVFQR